MGYDSDYVLEYPQDATISNLLLNYNLQNTPLNKPALIDGLSGEVVYTYQSLRIAIRKLAKYLQDNVHIRRGSIVSLMASNTVHYPVIVHAILAAGGTVSALNPLHKSQEIAHSLSISTPSHIIVENGLFLELEEALHIVKQQKPLVHLISLDSINPSKSSINLHEILKYGSAEFEPARYSAEVVKKELAFICFSSGTSGLPKGVKLSHGNIVANTFQHSILLEGMFNPTSVFVLVVPFFHILGLGAFTCQYLSQGAPIVVFPRYDLPSLVTAIKRDRITHINVVPPIVIALLRDPRAKDADFSSVSCIINAAAPLEQSLSDKLCKRLDCVLIQWYGLTEASPSVISQRWDQVHIQNTIGKLLPGISMKLLDNEGNEVKHGSPGELCISGPNIMQGYLRDQALTAEAIMPGGYLRTGDIGYVNDDGFVFLIERAKEMIKVKGNQVAPAELDGILRNHPLVEDAAVCGLHIPHEATDIPIAFITTNVPASNHEALCADVSEFVDDQVTSYKKLRGNVFVIDEIPRNPSGKILRRLLPKDSVKAKSFRNQATPKL